MKKSDRKKIGKGRGNIEPARSFISRPDIIIAEAQLRPGVPPGFFNHGMSYPHLLRKFRSASRPVAGDFVGLQVIDGRWVCGRIIATDAWTSVYADVWQECILLYLYSAVFAEQPKMSQVEGLRDLLVPPMILAREPWSRKFVKRIGNRKVKPADRLPRHCFQWCSNPPTYFNEYGHQWRQRFEPCGQLCVTLLGGLEYEIANAVGVLHDFD